MSYWNTLFFSSRRRHTRLQGDWSSDVCSSDLAARDQLEELRLGSGDGDRGDGLSRPGVLQPQVETQRAARLAFQSQVRAEHRSEERRVGKGGRAWRSGEQ